MNSLNSTLLVLVTTKENAEQLWNFKPVSLVDSFYTWLAKVLYNRLKNVMSNIVTESP